MKKLLWAIPVICVTFAACNSHDSGAKSSSEKVDTADWKITLKVKEALMGDSSISTDNSFVSVDTKDGVVTLTGNVSSQEQIDRIVKTTKSVQGVRSVNNQLVVSD